MSANRPGPASRPRDSGVEGNSRLTSTNGMLLLALLAVEGFTVLSVRQMITLHVFLGTLLIGPVLLKIGSTAYRFARYYTGAPAYVDKGPPHWLWVRWWFCPACRCSAPASACWRSSPPTRAFF